MRSANGGYFYIDVDDAAGNQLATIATGSIPVDISYVLPVLADGMYALDVQSEGGWTVNMGGGGGGYRTMTEEEMREMFGTDNPFSDFFNTFFGGAEPGESRRGRGRTRSRRGRDLEHEITLTLEESARECLMKEGYDPQYGARPMRRAVEKHIEDPLAEALLRGDVREGDTVKVINEPNAKELKFISLGENSEPPAEARRSAAGRLRGQRVRGRRRIPERTGRRESRSPAPPESPRPASRRDSGESGSWPVPGGRAGRSCGGRGSR